MRVSAGTACLSRSIRFSASYGGEHADARGVAAWSCKACNETVTDWIANARKNNRDRFGRRYSRPRGRRTDSKNDVDVKRYQFGRRRFQLLGLSRCDQLLGLSRCEAILDDDISSIGVATLAQPIQD